MDIRNILNYFTLLAILRGSSFSEIVYTDTPSGYIGCFEDQNGIMQGGQKINFKDNTGNACKAYCQVSNYMYAGTKNGFVCSCGNSLQPAVRSVACHTECPGNRCEKCGGPDSVSVYTTGSCHLHYCSFGPHCFKVFKDRPQKYSCDCNSKWSGGFCDEDKGINECLSNPCNNKATCIDVLDGFRCLESGITPTTSNYQGCLYQVKTTSIAKLTSSSTSDTVTESTSGKMLSAATSATTANDWVSIGDKQVCVVETPIEYDMAVKHCITLSASLLSYTNPLQYFNLSNVLRLTDTTYWIGSALGDKCVCFSMVHNSRSLRIEPCESRNSFICGRIANATMIKENAEFVKLLNNMTVNAKMTNKAQRKLISVQDNRLSTKFVGAVGILFICGCVGLVILADINWSRCKSCSRKQN
ncbi:protein crumbs-like [Ruditapes philippinarum]|uniref:protein crumbs-like n=1 Tax=Ruditapes philippinarum TaxID=129788 RepID=UPI00295B1EA6|nr:protein crumbs-like [Ruditapes philippinarum]